MGLALGATVFVFAKIVGLDRDGALYPVVVIVTAFYYVLFAVMGGSRQALMAEAVGAAVFTTLAVLGFRWTPWVVVAALAGHGLFDLVHASMIADAGVPVWWPAFCLGIDVGLAALVAFQIHKTKPRQPIGVGGA